jgi:hypothetical protein
MSKNRTAQLTQVLLEVGRAGELVTLIRENPKPLINFFEMLEQEMLADKADLLHERFLDGYNAEHPDTPLEVEPAYLKLGIPIPLPSEQKLARMPLNKHEMARYIVSHCGLFSPGTLRSFIIDCNEYDEAIANLASDLLPKEGEAEEESGGRSRALGIKSQRLPSLLKSIQGIHPDSPTQPNPTQPITPRTTAKVATPEKEEEPTEQKPKEKWFSITGFRGIHFDFSGGADETEKALKQLPKDQVIEYRREMNDKPFKAGDGIVLIMCVIALAVMSFLHLGHLGFDFLKIFFSNRFIWNLKTLSLTEIIGPFFVFFFWVMLITLRAVYKGAYNTSESGSALWSNTGHSIKCVMGSLAVAQLLSTFLTSLPWGIGQFISGLNVHYFAPFMMTEMTDSSLFVGLLTGAWIFSRKGLRSTAPFSSNLDLGDDASIITIFVLISFIYMGGSIVQEVVLVFLLHLAQFMANSAGRAGRIAFKGGFKKRFVEKSATTTKNSTSKSGTSTTTKK